MRISYLYSSVLCFYKNDLYPHNAMVSWLDARKYDGRHRTASNAIIYWSLCVFVHPVGWFKVCARRRWMWTWFCCNISAARRFHNSVKPKIMNCHFANKYLMGEICVWLVLFVCLFRFLLSCIGMLETYMQLWYSIICTSTEKFAPRMINEWNSRLICFVLSSDPIVITLLFIQTVIAMNRFRKARRSKQRGRV